MGRKDDEQPWGFDFQNNDEIEVVANALPFCAVLAELSRFQAQWACQKIVRIIRNKWVSVNDEHVVVQQKLPSIRNINKLISDTSNKKKSRNET